MLNPINGNMLLEVEYEDTELWVVERGLCILGGLFRTGGGNAEAYQCNKYGEKLKVKKKTFTQRVKNWFDNLGL